MIITARFQACATLPIFLYFFFSHFFVHFIIERCCSNLARLHSSYSTATIRKVDLEQLVLESHVGLGLKTDAGTENVGQSSALLGKGVDNRGARRSQGGLEHVAEDAENAVEVLKVTFGRLPLDARHHLGKDDEINDEGRGQERVLANVEERNGLVTTHKDLGIVLIEGTLVVGDGRHVLDDDAVVWVLTLLVENRVGLDHVVDDVGLGNLLGAELLLGAQVLAVVVAKVVVAGNRGELDASVDEKVNESRLHFGLARLEVITANEGVVLLGELDGTGNKSVLGRAVDEGSALEDTGNSENGGGRNLLVTLLDGLEQVVGRVVDARDKVGVALRVGGPHDNDLVEAVLLLELANVGLDLLDVSHAGLAALEDIVGTVLLVGGNKVGIIDGRQGNHVDHLLLDLGLEGGLEDLSAVHGVGKVHLADIPTTNGNVVGVNHGKDVVEGNVNLLAGLDVGAELEGRTHDDGAVVVGLARALLGLPAEAAAVGEDAGGDGGTVVAAPADQHHAHLGDLALDLELIGSFLGSGDKVSAGVRLDAGGAVRVLGSNLGVSVGDVGRVDLEGGGDAGSRGAGSINRPVRGAVVGFRVRSHG